MFASFVLHRGARTREPGSAGCGHGYCAALHGSCRRRFDPL